MELSMMKSRNEIRKAATAFLRRWKNAKHSLAFDKKGKYSGGQYARYPFDTTGFKWE